MATKKATKKARVIAARLSKSFRKMTPRDLDEVSRRARKRATSLRREQSRRRQAAAQDLVKLARRKRLLRGYRVLLDIDENGQVTLKLRSLKRRGGHGQVPGVPFRNPGGHCRGG